MIVGQSSQTAVIEGAGGSVGQAVPVPPPVSAATPSTPTTLAVGQSYWRGDNGIRSLFR
jgi:hypothetical protein